MSAETKAASTKAVSVPVFTATGSKRRTDAALPKTAALSDSSLATAVQNMLANARRERPLAKTRAMVAGGGRKPWRQKGTGRARAGTSSSPIWRGGGITFGPSGESRPYRQLNRKLRQRARLTVLNQLADENRLMVLAGAPKLAKTNEAAKLTAKLEMTKGVVAVSQSELDGAIGFRNLRDITLTSASDLTIVDLLSARTVLLSEAALDELTGKTTPKAEPKKTPTKKGPRPAAKSDPAKAATKEAK